MREFGLAVAALAVALQCASAQAPVPPPPSSRLKIDFAAPPQDHVVEFSPDKTRASLNPIRFTFRGWVYAPEGLSMTSPDANKFPPEERRLRDALAAAKKQGIIAIVPFWSPAEQAGVKKTVSEPNVNAGMTSFLRSVENSIFLGKVLYGPYSIMLVQHIGESLPASQAPARYTLKKVGDQYYLTDDLSADPVFMYLTEKYVRQLVAQITGQQP